jgi:hypothetical protein
MVVVGLRRFMRGPSFSVFFAGKHDQHAYDSDCSDDRPSDTCANDAS